MLMVLRLPNNIVIVSKTYPSFLTVKEGSLFPPKPLFNSLYAPFGSPSSGGQKPSGTRGCNRPPVLGTATLLGWRGIKALARCAGWDRMGNGA